MESITKQTEKNLVLRRLLKYLTIVAGSVIYAVGFQFFMFHETNTRSFPTYE